MADPITVPTFDELDASKPLDEAQLEAIKADKETDWDAPKEEKTAEPEKEPEKEPEAKPEESEKEPEKTPEDLEADKKTQEEAKEAEKAEKAEVKRLEKRSKELDKPVEEVKILEEEEKAEVERLEKVAKEEGLTAEEVKELESKDKSIAERHGNDPIKISRALRKEQSEYGKLKNEVETLRAFKETAEVRTKQFNEKRFNESTEAQRDKIVDTYREQYPEESDTLSDDACFERGRFLIKEKITTQQAEKEAELSTKAEGRVKELVKEIPEEFKPYIPEIKKLIQSCDPGQILSDKFDVAFFANYERGKKYTPDYVKSLEDSAYKRGLEKPTIIPRVPPSKPEKPSKSKVDTSGATSEDQHRAEEIYGRREGWTKDRMLQEYVKSDKGKDF